MDIVDQSGVIPSSPVPGQRHEPPQRLAGRAGRRPVPVLQIGPECRTTVRGVVVTGVPAAVFRRSRHTPPADDGDRPPPRGRS
jgi:hypothetical protein